MVLRGPSFANFAILLSVRDISKTGVVVYSDVNTGRTLPWHESPHPEQRHQGHQSRLLSASDEPCLLAGDSAHVRRADRGFRHHGRLPVHQDRRRHHRLRDGDLHFSDPRGFHRGPCRRTRGADRRAWPWRRSPSACSVSPPPIGNCWCSRASPGSAIRFSTRRITRSCQRVSANSAWGGHFSIHSATGYVGFAIAPIFMTGVAGLWHWRAAFILIGIIGLIAVLLLILQSDALRDTGQADRKKTKKPERTPRVPAPWTV